MTQLRREFIDRLQSRGLSPLTIRNYVAAVRDLTKHFRRSPCELTSEQILSYQLYLLRERRLAAATVNLHMDIVSPLDMEEVAHA